MTVRTLHVRCGSDIREKLREAGLDGDFLEYADPICQGPVPDAPDLPRQRARFIADAYGGFMSQDFAATVTRLEEERKRLEQAHCYDQVVMWFEHDSYDQLLLARCLAHFANCARPPQLELICIDRHPDVQRFLGLGQLGPAALAALWPTRAAVTEAQLELGKATWTTLRQPDPTGLQAIAATGTPALPIMAPALRRHLQELPGVADGLSLTQRLVLQCLAAAPMTIGRIFGALMHDREPLPFLGDIMLLPIVEQMASTSVLTIAEADRPFSRLASITQTGRDVLARRIDYLSLRPPARWVGGSQANGQWRWDESINGIVPAA